MSLARARMKTAKTLATASAKGNEQALVEEDTRRLSGTHHRMWQPSLRDFMQSEYDELYAIQEPEPPRRRASHDTAGEGADTAAVEKPLFVHVSSGRSMPLQLNRTMDRRNGVQHVRSAVRSCASPTRAPERV